MKKTLMSCILAMGVLSSQAFAEENLCFMKFTIDRDSPTLAEFNYRMNDEVANSLLFTVALGESEYVSVQCNQTYEIFATPVARHNSAKRSGVPPLGRCTYIGNKFFMGDRGISVVYPQDFICE